MPWLATQFTITLGSVGASLAAQPGYSASFGSSASLFDLESSSGRLVGELIREVIYVGQHHFVKMLENL